MSSANEPNFDWAQAASLLGDDPNDVADDMNEIVVELIDNAAQQFDELRKKDATTQMKEIRAQAHQLRGSLLNFGFTEVGTVLLHIEKDSYPPAEFPGEVEKAWTVFLASKKLLAARYPSLRFS